MESVTLLKLILNLQNQKTDSIELYNFLKGKNMEDLLNDPEAMERYAEAQSQMTGALSRLMAVSERYPDLKSDALFQDLQAQLEGTENRIAVARNRYIQEVQGYNTTVRQFPTNITAKVFGMETKPNFTVANEDAISTAPEVDFGE